MTALWWGLGGAEKEIKIASRFRQRWKLSESRAGSGQEIIESRSKLTRRKHEFEIGLAERKALKHAKVSTRDVVRDDLCHQFFVLSIHFFHSSFYSSILFVHSISFMQVVVWLTHSCRQSTELPQFATVFLLTVLIITLGLGAKVYLLGDKT